MKALTFLSLVGLVCSSAVPEKQAFLLKDHEDASLTVPELIRKYGYPCEEYRVVTPDNYILTIHRIPHGKSTDKATKGVVFLMHGLLSSSADWILTGVGNGLGYIMADEGYDVWMGNARGNKLSRNHSNWDPDTSDQFWNFSWHEIGVTDLPTMIDFALKTTGEPNLFYIGHSQGTTSFYVMASTRPEYNAKIRAQFSLAPIAFMNHMTSFILRYFAFWTKSLGALMKIIGVNEFLPNNDFIKLAGDRLCSDDAKSQFLCTNMLFLICGFSPDQMNATLLPVIAGHTPAGASTKQIIHYGQEIRSGYFRQYDHGFRNNKKIYGTAKPPNYDLKAISAPVYLLYSSNDWLAAIEDVERLYDGLGNCMGKFLVPDDSFNHLDFLFGIDAPQQVYDEVIRLMSMH